MLETLDDLSTRGGVRSILLTGNTRAGARAKLSYYGLEAYFPYGAFSDDKPDRLSIARDALVLARALSPGLRADNCFVIGDTPHDIACGKAIGARTIAIASGEFTLEQLQACGPWLALEALSPVLIAQAVGLD